MTNTGSCIVSRKTQLSLHPAAFITNETAQRQSLASNQPVEPAIPRSGALFASHPLLRFVFGLFIYAALLSLLAAYFLPIDKDPNEQPVGLKMLFFSMRI